MIDHLLIRIRQLEEERDGLGHEYHELVKSVCALVDYANVGREKLALDCLRRIVVGIRRKNAEAFFDTITLHDAAVPLERK